MTTPALNAVGFCAHYSAQGDWAFAYALDLSRRHGIQLNVFHFLADPYDTSGTAPEYSSRGERERLIVEKERELRLYYDARAGDYLNVGFRLCEHREWTELHRCLRIRQFQVLVLGYAGREASFAGKPIEEFADAFVCPVVLVGPERPDQYHLNHPASIVRDRFRLAGSNWRTIDLVPG